jgi:hypothetical protein
VSAPGGGRAYETYGWVLLLVVGLFTLLYGASVLVFGGIAQRTLVAPLALERESLAWPSSSRRIEGGRSGHGSFFGTIRSSLSFTSSHLGRSCPSCCS